jgi:hypothetical protein
MLRICCKSRRVCPLRVELADLRNFSKFKNGNDQYLKEEKNAITEQKFKYNTKIPHWQSFFTFYTLIPHRQITGHITQISLAVLTIFYYVKHFL